MICTKAFEKLVSSMRKNSIDDNGCLIWLGPVAGGLDYGKIWWAGKTWSIHRLVYMMYTGETPEVVRHTCDNPRCWNFLHLVGGTQYDNIVDKVAKNRQAKGIGHGCAKLTEDQVFEIRASNARQIDLAEEFEVSPALIGRIKRNEIWTHLKENHHVG